MLSFSWKAALSGAAIVAGAAVAAHAASSLDFTPPFMHEMNVRTGYGSGMIPMGAIGMSHDAATMAQLGTIHELFLNHDRITRTVSNLPGGIRTTTESNDPHIAQLLKEHVASKKTN